MYDIAFLHTGEVHINTFQHLIDELAPELKITHLAEQSLLDYAREFGQDTKLQERLEGTVKQLASEAKLVVCTCSSIGELAENCSTKFSLNVQRIDRAMADKAVMADNVLVLAALESTLSPTKTLIEQSATHLGRKLQCSYQVVDGAWQYFESGDQAAYCQMISKAITANQTNYDVIVLAQASMAGACALYSYSIPVLASPRLGVQAAIDSL